MEHIKSKLGYLNRDSKCIWIIKMSQILSLLSIAKVIALQNSSEKELGYYDEYDTANRKNLNSQIIQLLRLIREFNGMQKDFNATYEKYQLPNKITPEYIKQKISYWKTLIKNKTILLYFDEIINVLKGKPKLNINLELQKYYDKNLKLTDEQKMKRWDNVIGMKHICMEEDKKLIDEYLRTGQYVYKVEFNQKAGRNIGILYKKQNPEDSIESYL